MNIEIHKPNKKQKSYEDVAAIKKIPNGIRIFFKDKTSFKVKDDVTIYKLLTVRDGDSYKTKTIRSEIHAC